MSETPPQQLVKEGTLPILPLREIRPIVSIHTILSQHVITHNIKNGEVMRTVTSSGQIKHAIIQELSRVESFGTKSLLLSLISGGGIIVYYDLGSREIVYSDGTNFFTGIVRDMGIYSTDGILLYSLQKKSLGPDAKPYLFHVEPLSPAPVQ